MPVHRIPRSSLDEDLKDITRKQGERVIDISYDGDEALVITEYITVETRLTAYDPDADVWTSTGHSA